MFGKDFFEFSQHLFACFYMFLMSPYAELGHFSASVSLSELRGIGFRFKALTWSVRRKSLETKGILLSDAAPEVIWRYIQGMLSSIYL